MSKPEILMIGSYPAWHEGPLEEAYTLHRYSAAPDPKALLAEVGPRVRAIATGAGAGVSDAVIDACPKAEIVAIFGVGLDAVNLDHCRDRGLRVTNTPDVLTDDVADLAVGMMLALGRGIVPADVAVRSGAWGAGEAPPLRRRLTGRRAGILGLGRIGRAIGDRLAGFAMPVAYSARAPKPVPECWNYLPDPVTLARESDVLFVALAATPETQKIVDARVLDALGPEGMLVNISRGATVDEAALLDALEGRRIAGAALDVFLNEPKVDPRFRALDNVLLQPHHASATLETRQQMGALVRDNLAAHFAGKVLLTPVI